MNTGSLVSLIVIVAFLLLGFLVWRGRDNGPLGRAERDAELARFVQDGTERDLSWRIMKLRMKAPYLARGKLSSINNWTAECRACLMLEMRLGIKPGKSLGDQLIEEETDLKYGRQKTQNSLTNELQGIKRARYILELLQHELEQEN